jgi:hypothetical protein
VNLIRYCGKKYCYLAFDFPGTNEHFAAICSHHEFRRNSRIEAQTAPCINLSFFVQIYIVKYIKGIVSRNFGVLFLVLLDRYEVHNRA